MAFDADRAIQRYLPEEREALLTRLLELATPAPTREPDLITLAETWEEAQKLHGDESGIGGLSTGYQNIDDITGGLRQGQLIIVFGDTGHGKSMLVQNITYNVADAGDPVLFVGLEMTNAENTERLQGIGATADLPVLYPKTIDLDYKDIEPVVKAGISQGVKLVVVDHLHMFEGMTSENEAQFLTAVCREMKMLAIRYKVPIILVSHISARTEAEEKNIPQMRHLKGSTSIKQLADSVLAVHNESIVSDLGGKAELTVMQRKNRRGRKQRVAKLLILDNARLAEPKAIPIFG